MSIIAYVGLPGSGKSYDVVANQIMPALEEGRRVVTNIPLNRDHVREVTVKGEIIDLPLEVVMAEPHKIDDYAVNGCLLVIDECWRLWPAGMKANQIPQVYKSMLAEHRHKVDSQGRSMQIVLCTQDLSQIAAFARQLVEQTFHHTKLTSVGASSSYRIDVFHGAVTGAVPPKSNRMREIFGKFKPEIFILYKSHTMSDSRKSGANEAAVDARGNIWRKPVVWIGAGAVAIMVVYGFTALGGLVSRYDPEPVVSVANQPAQDHSLTGPRTFAQPVSRPMSASNSFSPVREQVPRYRLIGVAENLEDPTRSAAMITDGKVRMIIAFDQCDRTAAGDVFCRYDGYRVSTFGTTKL